MRWRRRLALAAVVVLAASLLMQFIPFGHQHGNPPVQAEPAWPSPATRALAQRACFACHGNQTTWPWYSNVAPVSWLVQNDVNSGRQRLNFQEWSRPQSQRVLQHLPQVVTDKQMPPSYYIWLHPAANLTDAERQQLADGLKAMLAQSQPPVQGR